MNTGKLLTAIAAIAWLMVVNKPAAADQGGISFWLPGAFGSLAASPGVPGWSFGTIYLHSTVSAGGDVAASRALRLGNTTTNLKVNLNANLHGDADISAFIPTYTFSEPLLGGQFALSMLTIFGNQHASIDANISGALGPIGFATSRGISDSLFSYGDLFPQATLKWNQGVHNFMVYGMTNLPVGDYDAHRLVNLGLGHWAIDGGVGYTYFDPKVGNEFSVVTGLTYNFTNPSLDYQNGIDWHIDWAASHFISKQVHIGLVGYFYQQITDDSGSGAVLGGFRSRVAGIGPQIGFIFPVGDMQGYLNIKGYKEFAAEHRPEGWNAWITFAISPEPPKPAAPPGFVK